MIRTGNTQKNVGFIRIKYNNIMTNIDHIMTKRNRNMVKIFEQGFVREQESTTLPMTTNTKTIGKNLKQYQIYGKSFQNGTPTPDDPIEINSVGDVIVETIGDLVLPQQYQEVEYIKATGTQYIDTGYHFSSTEQRMELDFSLDARMGNQTIFGASAGSVTTTSSLSLRQREYTGTYIAYGTKSALFSEYYFTTGARQNLDCSAVNGVVSIKINGSLTRQHELTSGGIITANTFLGALNSDSGSATNFSKITIYRFKMYDDETLVRDFVPCYRKSDSVIGMYDVVSGSFYTNQGTGTFERGQEVNRYKIPVTATNGTDTITTNIILNEPLRKIGDNADYIDFKNQKVVRKFGRYQFNGNETIARVNTTSSSKYRFGIVTSTITNIISVSGSSDVNYILCTHLKASNRNNTWNLDEGIHYGTGTSQYGQFTIYTSKADTTVAAMQSWLSTDKPVVIYEHATPVEELVSLPDIPTIKGKNVTFDVSTSIKPSKMKIIYRGE